MAHTVITLPATVDEAIQSLDGIGRLITAKGWERAALIYCLTTNEGKGRPAINGRNVPFTQAEFAALGITGLTGRTAVRLYRQRWVEYGDNDIMLGDKVVLPDIDWPTIESRPNKNRVAAMDADDLASHVAARPDADKVVTQVITAKAAEKIGRTHTPGRKLDTGPAFDDTDMGLWATSDTELTTARSIIDKVADRLSNTGADLGAGNHELLQRRLDEIHAAEEAVRTLIRINVEAQR